MTERIRIVLDGDSDGVIREYKKTTAAGKSMSRELQAEARRASGVYQDAAGKWREANGRFVTSARQAELGIKGVGEESQRTASKVESSSRRQVMAGKAVNAALKEQRRTVQQVTQAAGRGGILLSLGLVGVGRSIIKTGAQYESQMARVRGVTNAGVKDFSRLDAAAKKWGAQTKYSAGEAADAMYELGSAGFKPKEIIAALPGVLSLAAASGIDLADAAEISSNALRGFGLDASKSTHVADVMSQAVNKSSLEMGDLQLSMKYVGSISRATGQDLETMTAAMEIMGNAGIKGEQAGTTLRGGLLRLVNPTKSVFAGFDQLGITTKTLQGPKGLKPLGDIVEILRQKTDKMSASQRNQALSQVFGTEALSGMLTLVQAGAPKLDRLTEANRKSDGQSKKSAKIMNDTVAGAFENLTGSIDTVKIALYQKFQEPLKHGLMDAAKLVNKEGKEVEEFFDRIANTKEFKAADLGGKIKILAEEAGKAWGDADLTPKISKALGRAVSEAAPVVAHAAGKVALTAADAFLHAFENADPIGKIVLGAVAMKKLGGFAAAGKLLGAGLKGAGGGGGGGILSSAKPIPVFVTNQGFGGAPGVGGAGPASTASKLGRYAPVAAGVATGVTGAVVAAGGVKGIADAVRGNNLDPQSVGILSRYRKEIDALTKSGNAPGLREMAKKLREAAAATQDLSKGTGAKAMADKLEKLAKSSEAMGGAMGTASIRQGLAVAAMNLKIKELATTHGRSLKDINQKTSSNMAAIRRSLGNDSAAGRDALAANFRAAAAAIKTEMDHGRISADAGMKAIKALTLKALGVYGIKGSSAEKFLAGTGKAATDAASSVGGDAVSGGKRKGAARGMLSRLPGPIGPDSIPMNVNGESIVAAPGEDVAIVNRHQRAYLDQRLADVGGFGGIFRHINTPHHLAGKASKAARGFVTGGIVTASKYGGRDDASAFGKSTASGVTANDGTQGFAELSNNYGAPLSQLDFAALGKLPMGSPLQVTYNGKSTVANKIDVGAGGPGLNGHKRAIDLAAGTASQIGFPGLADVTVGDAGQGGALNVAGAALAKRIVLGRVRAQGVGGALQGLVQAGLDRVLAAAQAKADQGRGGDLSGAVGKMIAFAQQMDGLDIPYGPQGHGGVALNLAGEDCSSSVSKVLLAGGVPLGGVQTTVTLPSVLKPGPGKQVTIHDRTAAGNAGHTIMEIAGKWFGTSRQNPKGGPGFFSQPDPGYLASMPTKLHPEGLASGGIVHAATGTPKVKKPTGTKLTTGPASTGGATRQKGGKVKSLTGIGLPVPRKIKKAARNNHFSADRIFGELKVAGYQNLLDQIQAAQDANGNDDKRYDLLQHEQGRTDEDAALQAMIEADSGLTQEQVNQQAPPLIAAHTQELDALVDLRKRQLGRFDGGDGMIALTGTLLRDLAKGLAERQERVADIKDALERNKRRIEESKLELRAEQSRPGDWRDKVRRNDKQLKGLQGDLKVEEKKKHPSEKVKDGLQGKIDAIEKETDRLKDQKPKGGSTIRKRRLMGELDFYQDLGTYLGGDDGLLGRTTAQMGTYAEDLKTHQNDPVAVSFDRQGAAATLQDVLDERAAWTGRPAPKIPVDTATPDDNGLLDLLKTENLQLKQAASLEAAQSSVFKGFGPLPQGRLLGSFARGIAHVPQDGLAVLHRDEMVVPDPQGPFGTQLRPAATPAPNVSVELRFEGDTGNLVRLIDARVDGRAATVASEQLGRRARTFSISPGG